MDFPVFSPVAFSLFVSFPGSIVVCLGVVLVFVFSCCVIYGTELPGSFSFRFFFRVRKLLRFVCVFSFVLI